MEDYPFDTGEDELNLPRSSTPIESIQISTPDRANGVVTGSQEHSESAANGQLPAGYRDEDAFGIVKKGKFCPASDFNFSLEAEVICTNPTSSGYLIKLTPSGSEDTRLCFFTASSINRKTDFMKCLNTSYKAACLTCSFTDTQLAEYIQFKKRAMPNLPKLYAVSYVGQQEDGSWVMSASAHISKTGQLMKVPGSTAYEEDASIDSSNYVWIGEMYSGPGIAGSEEKCCIELPLTTDPLCELMQQLRDTMQHNFFPCILTMASSIIVLHYQQMQGRLSFCPIPLAFGSSGTGKSTALKISLAMLGIFYHRFYCSITKEKIIDLCCSSGVPLGVDDPQSKGDISNLMISLYNGAGVGTVSRGKKVIKTSCIIAANFTTRDQQKYASRCILIKFNDPAIPFKVNSYAKLSDLSKTASSCIGFCISLGEKFFCEGINDIDNDVIPMLKGFLGPNTSPRVIPAYAILYWFASKLLTEVGMDRLLPDLQAHFRSDVLTTIATLQSSEPIHDEIQTVPAASASTWSIDDGGQELLKSMENLSKPQIATFFRTNLQYDGMDAYGIVLNKVPNVENSTKKKIRDFVKVKTSPSRGLVSNPRPFLPEHLATLQQVPADIYKYPPVRCTIIVTSCFSEDIQLQLEQASGYPSSSRISKRPLEDPQKDIPLGVKNSVELDTTDPPNGDNNFTPPKEDEIIILPKQDENDILPKEHENDILPKENEKDTLLIKDEEDIPPKKYEIVIPLKEDEKDIQPNENDKDIPPKEYEIVIPLKEDEKDIQPNDNDKDIPPKEYEIVIPLKEDEKDIQPNENEKDILPKEHEIVIPLKEDRKVKEDESVIPSKQDKNNIPQKEDKKDIPPKEDEIDTSLNIIPSKPPIVGRKRYLTRSSGSAPSLSKKMKKERDIY